MIWLVSALAASLLGLWYTWSRGLQAPALVLVVLTFALVFALGRRIEAGRDSAWQQAAERVQGSFRPAPGVAWLAAFGPGPWSEWASDGELQCIRAIDAPSADPPFALLQIRYSVRERRGEEHPDTWHEVTVAAVRLAPGAPVPALTPVPAGAGATAVHNGQWGFVWRQGQRGAGASLDADELPALAEQARRALRPFSRAGAAGSSAGPAGPSPAAPRTPP